MYDKYKGSRLRKQSSCEIYLYRKGIGVFDVVTAILCLTSTKILKS